jgi:GT2 family glycosyltransferase
MLYTSPKSDVDERDWKEPPSVSVIVLNWNGQQIIRSSLDSIKKLKYTSLEVIVVDNGSTDKSVDIIAKEYPEFRLIRNSRNLGFSTGMNVGIRTSHGNLVLLCNNDVIAHPSSLSFMVDAMGSKKVGIVGGLILYVNPKDAVGSFGGKIDPVTGQIWADSQGKKLSAEDQLKHYLIEDLDYVSGCAFLARKDLIERIGLFDEQIILSGQDIDFCLKARRLGFNCMLAPRAVFWHIGSYSSRRMPLESYTERLKSDFQTIMLHFPAIPMFSALFFQLALMPFFEMHFYKQSDLPTSLRLKARVRAFSAVLKGIGVITNKRKQIGKLGDLHLKPRGLELMRFAFFRSRSKEFYMGKLLQKVE